MATFLYRLGKASYERAGRVLLAWLIGLIAIAGGGFALAGSTDEEFWIPGSESQEAFGRLEAVFPTFAGASAQAVVVAPEGERLDERDNRLAVISLVAVAGLGFAVSRMSLARARERSVRESLGLSHSV